MDETDEEIEAALAEFLDEMAETYGLSSSADHMAIVKILQET